MHRSWIGAIASAVALLSAVPTARPEAQSPSAAYAPPLTADGHPDIQGIWQVWNTARYDIEDHSARWGVPAGRSVIIDPPDGKIPYQAWALEKRKQHYEGTKTTNVAQHSDEVTRCYNPGVPRLTYLGWPFQIIQTSKYVAVVYEWMHHRRFIYYDPNGRLEGVDFWMGDSRGRWEGNTLVVDVANVNDRTWFDMTGNFHSARMRLVEKYTPIGPDTLNYEVEVTDPDVFTRPWKMAMTIHRRNDVGQLLEYQCHALLRDSGVPLTWERK